MSLSLASFFGKKRGRLLIAAKQASSRRTPRRGWRSDVKSQVLHDLSLSLRGLMIEKC